MNNLKESFSIMKAITTTTTILNDNSISRYTYLRMLFNKAINFLLTTIGWSFGENIRPTSFMYGLRPASSFRTVKISVSWIFTVFCRSVRKNIFHFTNNPQSTASGNFWELRKIRCSNGVGVVKLIRNGPRVCTQSNLNIYLIIFIANWCNYNIGLNISKKGIFNTLSSFKELSIEDLHL